MEEDQIPEEEEGIPNIAESEEEEAVPTIAEEEGAVPNIAEEEEVVPYIVEEVEAAPYIAEEEEVIPYLAEEEEAAPYIAEEEEAASHIAEEEEVVPCIAEEEEVAPYIVEEGAVHYIADEEEAVPYIAEEEEVVPYLAEEEEAFPYIAEEEEGMPYIAEEEEEEVDLYMAEEEDEEAFPCIAEEEEEEAVPHVAGEAVEAGQVVEMEEGEEDDDEEYEEEEEEDEEDEEGEEEDAGEGEREADGEGIAAGAKGAHHNDDEEENEACDDDEEDKTKVYSWDLLPDVCLRRVFRWLPDGDRVRADRACRRWHAVMRSPSLWRQRCFSLTGRLSKFRRSEHQDAITYARYLGVYLETLEVSFIPPLSSIVARRLQNTLKGLLDELTRSGARLRSLSLTGLELDRPCWSRSLRGSLVRSLARFLRCSAAQLTSLSLKNTRTTLQQGLELLSALSLSQQHLYLRGRPGITSLDLTDFFCGSLNVHLHPSLPRALHKLQGLTSLGLSYSCLSDELLQELGTSAWGGGAMGRGCGRDGGSIRLLTLYCHVEQPHAQVVYGGLWTALAESCPGLEVHLHVDQVVNTDRLARVLLPEMPLSEFSMTSCYFTEHDWSAKPVLTEMLTQYKNSLKRLTLDMNNCSETLDSELVEMVKVCVSLQHLKVWGFFEIDTVGLLLKHRLESRGSCLNNIRVRVYSVHEESQEEEERQLHHLLSLFPSLPPELSFSAIICPVL